MSAQPQVNAATCGTEVTSLLRILEAPEIRTAYVKKLKPYEVTIVNLALGGALYGKTKYLVDKGQNPADHSSNYILGSCGSRLPVCGGGAKGRPRDAKRGNFTQDAKDSVFLLRQISSSASTYCGKGGRSNYDATRIPYNNRARKRVEEAILWWSTCTAVRTRARGRAEDSQRLVVLRVDIEHGCDMHNPYVPLGLARRGLSVRLGCGMMMGQDSHRATVRYGILSRGTPTTGCAGGIHGQSIPGRLLYTSTCTRTFPQRGWSARRLQITDGWTQHWMQTWNRGVSCS